VEGGVAVLACDGVAFEVGLVEEEIDDFVCARRKSVLASLLGSSQVRE
jgi:hypothetical protein